MENQHPPYDDPRDTRPAPQEATPQASQPATPFRCSEEINEIATALAKAQGEIKSPPKNKTVKVKTKNGYSYDFKYATLDAIIDTVRGPLTKNGIWFIQTLKQSSKGYILTTTLTHSSGQWIASDAPLMVQGQGNQEFGSALTYMKRYAISSMLGVAADEDDDGNAAEGNQVTEQSKPAAKTQPKQSASPKMSKEEEDCRKNAAQIKDDINNAKTLESLNKLWSDHDVALEDIKKLSKTAYDDLEKRYKNRQFQFAQEPTEEKK